MRYVCLFAAFVTSLYAQDGAKIYNQRCAACHDHPADRVPAISTIKKMSGEAIYRVLTNGPMKKQAEGLSMAELFALIGSIGPTGAAQPPTPTALLTTCKVPNQFHLDATAPQWNGWSATPTNSRFQNTAAAGLAASDVPKLKLKWAFNLGDITDARSQPTVVGNRVFIGTTAGLFYSLDADSGCTEWGFRADTALRGGSTMGDVKGIPAIFFSDSGAKTYAVNAQTGQLIWKNRIVDHFASLATATPRYFKGVLYQPISSFEEALAGDPKYQCCTFRGSVLAIDAATGAKLWQTFTVPQTAQATAKSPSGVQQFGPSGAGIWSTPTIDEQLGVLYVATGDNYSTPATEMSDSVIAIELSTGKLLWSKQLTANDVYNNACSNPMPGNCPGVHGADSDFGQPPMLVTLADGKRALVLAQKSGWVYAIDPDSKGRLLWHTKVGAGSPLGGSQWGSAADPENIYVAISDIALSGVPDPKSPVGYRLILDPKKGGGLHALDLKTGNVQWDSAPTPCAGSRTDCSPAQSAALSAIPGIVFSGSVDGHLRAYSTGNGKVLWDMDTAHAWETVNGPAAHGGSIDSAGPVIVGGTVFATSGYGQWGGMPGNALLAFSTE